MGKQETFTEIEYREEHNAFQLSMSSRFIKVDFHFRNTRKYGLVCFCFDAY